METARRRSQPAQTTPEVRPKGRKHDETGDRIALTPVLPVFYPAYLPANRQLTSLQPEIPQQPPRTVPKSNYLRVQPVEPAALADGTATNIGELTVKNLLAAATLCLSLATPALASVELSPEQLDSVTAGVQLILNFDPAASAASRQALADQLQSQGWKVELSGNTLTATLGAETPKITVNNFTYTP